MILFLTLNCFGIVAASIGMFLLLPQIVSSSGLRAVAAHPQSGGVPAE